MFLKLFQGVFALVCLLCASTFASAQEEATNPNIWADVPDMAVVRVGNDYYMSSTTMHLSPCVPIMKSTNLVDWQIVGYACSTLGDSDELALRNGKNSYGRGTWASSLRYKDGVFYLATFSGTTGKTYIFSTRDVAGKWDVKSFFPMCHDCSLFFDDDGKAYLLYGCGDLRLTELNDDLSGFKRGGFDSVVIKNAGRVAGGRIGLSAEGSQMFKRNGKYYVCNISWPQGDVRTEIVFRADNIAGPYEGRVIFKDRGIAQGTLFEGVDGKWFAYLFQDSGAVGRIPYLMPVEWKDDWPIVGIDGKAPDTMPIQRERKPLEGVVCSDEFERNADVLARLEDAPKEENAGLSYAFPLEWQWNHNPDARYWSLTERPGWLTLEAGRVDRRLSEARNTLSQRTFGPVSSASTALDVRGLNNGDFAGLTFFQRKYGFVGVAKRDGKFYVVQVESELARGGDVNADTDRENARVALDETQEVVYFKIDANFRDRADVARFYWSLDGKSWQALGKPLRGLYTLPHFMGYRFGLFHYATQTPGGRADFDYYRVDDQIDEDAFKK